MATVKLKPSKLWGKVCQEKQRGRKMYISLESSVNTEHKNNITSPTAILSTLVSSKNGLSVSESLLLTENGLFWGGEPASDGGGLSRSGSCLNPFVIVSRLIPEEATMSFKDWFFWVANLNTMFSCFNFWLACFKKRIWSTAFLSIADLFNCQSKENKKVSKGHTFMFSKWGYTDASTL